MADDKYGHYLLLDSAHAYDYNIQQLLKIIISKINVITLSLL